MPGRSWDNDASYRRRLIVILPGVLLALAALVFFTRRMAPTDIYKYVGWRGELELLPEITIVPDRPAPDATPARTGENRDETVALEVAEAPGEFQPNPPRVESRPQKVISPVFDDLENAPSVRTPDQQQVSYSDKYVILRMVKPRYPPRELAEGIEGNVTVALLVNERGFVSDASVLALLGPQSFQEAALEAARLFEFQAPTDEHGRPTTMWVKFLIKFRVYG